MGRDKEKIKTCTKCGKQKPATLKFVLVHQETGEIRKIDVKTTSYRQSWKPGTRIARQRTPEQVKLKVEYEFLDKDEDV